MYNKTVLENGLRIVSERLDHFRSVSLGIWVNVGSRDEVERENGVSHFIEHMIFKGTANRSSLQIAKELDAIGGLSNAFTGIEYTCFHSRVLDKHLRSLSEILSDIFLHSLFDPQDMSRERQVILQEINMLEDTPDEQIHVLFSRQFWLNHPLGMPVMGTPETVSSIDKRTVLSHIRRFYTPARIIVAAAGNVDHEDLVRYFRSLFESLPKETENPPRLAPVNHAAVSCQFKNLELRTRRDDSYMTAAGRVEVAHAGSESVESVQWLTECIEREGLDVEFQIGPHSTHVAVGERAELRRRHAHRARPLEEVFEADAHFAQPRCGKRVERRHAVHFEYGTDLEVVLQVLADARQIVPDCNAMALQQRAGADAGKLQDLRAADSACSE